jgi:hypothetical protein
MSPNSRFIEFDESRMIRTFVFAPEFAWRSCRSSGLADDAIRKRQRNVVATRYRAANPISPRDPRRWCRMAVLSPTIAS